jgi:hypothetical protein
MPYAKAEAEKPIKVEAPPTAPPTPIPTPPAIPTWVVPLAIAATAGIGIAIYLASRR